MVRGSAYRPRQAWFYEHLFEHETLARSEGVRTRRWKYVRYLDLGYEQLFDLKRDPYEECNLADSFWHCGRLRKMRELWRCMQRQAE